VDLQQTLLSVEQTQTTSDDYYTPAWVFEALGLTFDLDVCAPPGGVLWVPASRYFTKADDGLSQPWEGRVWMNPPYSDPTPWVERFVLHRDGICLVPSSNGRWQDLLWKAVDGICLGEPSLQFVGSLGAGIPRRTFFAAFGEECVKALHRVGHVR
jgi:hypothetical protein